MHLLCLNVQSGGGARWGRILDLVDKHRPDVAVFTEWRQAQAQGPAATWAESRGMHCDGACDGATKNGIFVASALPFKALSVTPKVETAGTLLRLEFESWTILAAYFPQGDLKAPYFKACSDTARSVGNRPFLLLGDLNTGNQQADKTPKGKKYKCDRLFDELSESHGLIDLWRRTHGAEAREWSWMTRANGFRLDHAFGNPAFVRCFDPTCRYDHSNSAARSIGPQRLAHLDFG